MEKVGININGKDYQVDGNLTILKAAESAGIHIPHMCYHPNISIIGSCRICVVEVEGQRALVASCAYPVSNGMKIKTDTERVQKARKLVVDLLLSDHPANCLTCDKSSMCKLQKYAYELGVISTSIEGRRHNYAVDESNPFIRTDYNACILCGRCVRVCQEVQFCNVLDFSKRGFETKLSRAMEKGLKETECVFCGNCVQVCPVGALSEKERRFEGREWDLKKVSTICPYCGCGCTIDVHVKNEKVVKISANEESPVNFGRLCVKGKFGYEFVNSPDRLKTPLIKENGKFREASWDEALGLITKKFGEIKERSGSDALGVFSSAKCTNEENFLMQKFARATLGTNNVDHCARLCHASSVAGLIMSFGSGASTNSFSEFRKTDCILITGSNTAESHPIAGLDVKWAVRFNNTKLIVIDPRKVEMVDYADLWLRQRPGTDVAWINGLANVIITEGLSDKEFINERTEEFEKFAENVKGYTPEKVEEITGIPAEDLKEAARTYAKAKNAIILWAMGITQHTTATDAVMGLANLAMLTGHIGKEYSGVNPLRGQNNVQGSSDMGALPNLYPGYQRVDDEQVRNKFENAWKVKLPAKPGLTIVEIIHAAESEKIKGMYIMGENPIISDPNIPKVKEGLEALEFLVVQDIFLTETAELADVVLPSACSFERDGTFTNTERRVQLLKRVIDPPGESKPDWQIICELSRRLGYDMNYTGTGQIMEEIAMLVPQYGGIRHERLKKSSLQWPCPETSHPGTKFLFKDKFPRGKGRFQAVEYKPAAELPDKEYPFLLTTGRILYHYHTGTMTRRSKGLNELRPHGVIEINPADAGRIGCNSGDVVDVSSRRGQVNAITEVTEKTPVGTVFMSFHFKEAAANMLTIDALDPIAKIPEYKVCAVKIKLPG